MTPNPHTAIERILQHIENRFLDLTKSYQNWIKFGFALSSLGESGRTYFHRLSRFHPEYDPAECDLQFTRCLEAKGSGISLATFFHLAKEAGIPLAPDAPVPSAPSAPSAPSEPLRLTNAEEEEGEPEEEKEDEKLPSLPDGLYDALPDFLRMAVAPAESREERDILLLGSMCVLSSCMPTIYGIYDGFEVYPNFYLFVTARASSGKGKLNLCKRLVLPIHIKKRKEAEEMRVLYDEASAEENDKEKKVAKPQEKMLILPANSSATGVFQLLAENDGRGLIFESEGDTLSSILKTDFGNYSDAFRKAFHHETISYYRRTDREYVDIMAPCLSTLLSGTPAQVHSLIPNAENGLFSRFLFYHLSLDPVWKDTFRNKNKGELIDYYHKLGVDFCSFYEVLCKQPPTQVTLTEDQMNRFYHFFKNLQSRYLALIEDGFLATVRRMGLICYRLMMVMSALRYMDKPLPYKIVCLNDDFNTAIGIIEVLLRHSNYVFSRLPNQKEVEEKPNLRVLLLRSLPQEFTWKDFNSYCIRYKTKRSSAYRLLDQFIREGLIHRFARGRYHLMEAENLWTPGENPGDTPKPEQ